MPASLEGDRILVELSDRKLSFPFTDLRKRVPGFWPRREWEERRSLALAGGIEDHVKAAWWALENGLTAEADAMVRAAYRIDPHHQPTRRMHDSIIRLEAPCGDPNLEPVLQAVGADFQVARGPHVLLLHQLPEVEAQERVQILESVLSSFYLHFAAQGFDLAPPPERVISVFYAQQRDYLDYLHRAGRDVFRSTRGYYHPTLDAVLAYDSRSAGAIGLSRVRLESRQQQLDQILTLLDGSTSGERLTLSVGPQSPRMLSLSQAKRVARELETEVNRRALSLELDRRAVDLGTAAHELIHQLVAKSQLAPRHDDFPVWLHEGLAAQFEVFRGGQWAGIGRAHELRLPDYRKVARRSSLSSLIEDRGFGRGYDQGLYAQIWALVYYLRKTHPREFVTFLDLLRTPTEHNQERGPRAASLFRRAFGEDLASLEADWHRFMDTLQTPLEEHRPATRP